MSIETRKVTLNDEIITELKKANYLASMAKENVCFMLDNDYDISTNAFKNFDLKHLECYNKQQAILNGIYKKFIPDDIKYQVTNYEVRFDESCLYFEVDDSRVQPIEKIYEITDLDTLEELKKYYMIKLHYEDVVSTFISMDGNVKNKAFQDYYALQTAAFEIENELKAKLFEETVENKEGVMRYSFDFDKKTISCVI